MTDKTPSKHNHKVIRSHLARLGKTPNKIAWSLAGYGIRGTPGESSDDPLCQYLDLVTEGEYDKFECGSQDSITAFHPSLTEVIMLSTVMQKFVVRFDMGVYEIIERPQYTNINNLMVEKYISGRVKAYYHNCHMVEINIQRKQRRISLMLTNCKWRTASTQRKMNKVLREFSPWQLKWLNPMVKIKGGVWQLVYLKEVNSKDKPVVQKFQNNQSLMAVIKY